MNIDTKNSNQKVYSVKRIYSAPKFNPKFDFSKFVVEISRINQDSNTPSHDFDLNEYKSFDSQIKAYLYFKNLHSFNKIYVLTF